MRFGILRVSTIALSVATISVACARQMNKPGANPMDPTRAAIDGRVPGQRASGSTEANVSRKRVDAKEEPATLVAADRTRCAVTDERFRDTKVGETVTCDWRAGTRSP